MPSLVALLLALPFAAACTGPPPDPLVVVKAFTGERVVSSLRVLGPDGQDVGEEYRPVVSHVPRLELRPKRELGVADGKLRQVYTLPPKWQNEQLLVVRRYKPKSEKSWLTLPAVAGRSTTGELTVDFEVEGEADPEAFHVYAAALIAPPAERTSTFRDLTIAPGTVLIGGYGLQPESSPVTTAPVEFRLTVRGKKGERVLLDVARDPGDPSAETWSDYRFDLGDLAGDTVEVELWARVRPTPGTEAMGFPVWSVPHLLAPRPPGEMLNVVLISLDTLRADFVGAYGHERDTTPNIDRFAAEGALFERAFTTYPSTTASHMSMLTGLYPNVHGVYAPGERISRDIRTLAEQLGRHGYQTAAVTEDGMLAARAGFLKGFADYREFKSELDTNGFVADVVSSALDWLSRHRNERFFLFLHTYQVHGPYAPPPEFDVFKTYEKDGEEHTVDASTSTMIKSRLGYEGDLLYTDSEIGRFLEALEELGEAERTLVVITADHGEALGEHGLLGHGWYVLDPVIHVPLILRAPGRVPAGVRVSSQASLVDVPPTILDLAGVPASAPMQGLSLAPLLAEPDLPRFRDRPVFTEKLTSGGDKLLVARKGDVKWVVRPTELQRFDLGSDPDERAAFDEEGEDSEGAKLAAAYYAGNEVLRDSLGKAKPKKAEVDDATLKKLRALGYIE